MYYKEGIDLKVVIILIILSAVIGAISAIAVTTLLPPSMAVTYKEFYTVESELGISPADYLHDLNKGISDGLVVDLRSSAEYKAGHLITAVNIPAVEMSTEQVINAYKSLPKDKPIINYCYSGYCMLSKHVGQVLANNGIYTKHMTAGWYEIQRDFPTSIATGADSNSIITGTAATCSITNTGDFTC